MNSVMVGFHPIVEKLWGHEKHIVNTPEYCGKILTVNRGYQCSLHYHELKAETFYVLLGRLVVEYYPLGDAADPRVVTLESGDSLDLPPGTPHRFWTDSKTSTLFVEFSTHDSPDDSIRLEESCVRPRAVLPTATDRQ
jgi:mannose-6-phosphate isomerase-like protein (cupin superfamily)